MSMNENELRGIISAETDQLISERFTENKIEDRTAQWRAGAPDAPTFTEQQVFTMAETRDFVEELLFRVLKKTV